VDRPPELVGVVLGAGSSRRLGRPKQTLPFGDTTVLGRVVGHAESSSLDRVVVVLGGAADDVRATLAPGRAIVTLNTAYGSGCASSLLAGLDAAGNPDGIVMLLGDMPGVDAALIDEVAGAWRADPGWAAVTSYHDGLGHPFVFSAAAFGDLRALHGDKAVWKILERETPGRVRRLPVARPLPPDIDTWDDYREACRRAGVAPGATGPTG
jgi:molybdenum cofactor cytidylyltransferase